MESQKRRIAVLVLGFPLTSEQFLVREFREIERQGVMLEIFPLRPKPRSRVPEDAIPLLPRVHYTAFLFSWKLLHANLRELFSRPVRYGAALARTLLFIRNPQMVIKHIALFPKSVFIARKLKQMGVTHIHAHWATVPAGVATIISRLSGISYSFTGHATDVFASKNHAGLRAKVRCAAFASACTLFGTHLLQRLCTTDQERDRIHLCHHGLVLQEYAVARRQSSPPLILSGGRLVEKKGLIYLIRALSILKNNSVAFEAVLIGGGPLREPLERAIALHGLEDRVRLTGFISHKEVKGYLARAAVFVAPSIIAPTGDMDGIPNLLLEAMACAKPVIAFSLPAIAEVIEDGVNGFLVPEKNVKVLAEKIETILRDTERAHDMGKAGREKVAAQFDLAENVSGFVNLLSRYSAFRE